jgi:5S rRNA maturation endonuclease (ribonuclease M5)
MRSNRRRKTKGTKTPQRMDIYVVPSDDGMIVFTDLDEDGNEMAVEESDSDNGE